MKTLMLVIVTLFFSFNTVSFANTSFHKNSSTLKAFSSAWKNYKALTPKLQPNDITMGYAGEDVYHRIFVTPHHFMG